MSHKPGPKPMFTKTNFDIPPNSLVTLWKKNGSQVTGLCYANPKYSSDVSSVELVNVIYDKTPQADLLGKRIAYMKIHERDISDWKVLMRSQNIDRATHNEVIGKLEQVVETHTIVDLQQLNHYAHALECFKVDKMAMALKGINLSRDGSLGWICILTDTMLLVCIDCKDKKRDSANQEWWNIIDEEIFSNDKITKVVYDVRPMIDFLYHRLSLDLVNVFDVQMIDVVLRMRSNKIQQPEQSEHGKRAGSNSKVSYDPLPFSQLVEEAKLEVLPQELNLLRAVESKDYSLNNPLMNRPLTQCMELKEVAISLRLMLELHKRQLALFTLPLIECAQAQINYMKNGCFMVSYEQAVQGQHYSPQVVSELKVKMINYTPQNSALPSQKPPHTQDDAKK